MKSQRLPKTWGLAIVVGLLTMLGCASSTAPDTFIPNFNATWKAQNDASHTFFLDASGNANNAPSGTFGASANEQFKGGVFTITGTFNHRDMQFTTDRLVNGSKASFTGHFADDNTITLQSPEGTITIVRVGG